MTKIKLTMLIFPLIGSISGLCAQAFFPVNGTDYPIELIEWSLSGDGLNRLSEMLSSSRSSTITFNPNNTVVILNNARYNTTLTFFSNGVLEFNIRALLFRRSALGTGRIERLGRDITFFISIPRGDEDRAAIVRGSIK